MPDRGTAAPGDVRSAVRHLVGGGGGRLALRVHRRQHQGEPAPGVVLVHGGGWHESGPDMLDPLGRSLAGLGYLAACAPYRLSTQATWPAQLHDVLAAVVWLREHHHELGVDPDRLALLGNSAGAQIATMLVTTGDRHAEAAAWARARRSLRALVLLSPVVDVHDDVTPAIAEAAERLVGGPDPERLRLRAVSPVAQVVASTPPTLTIVGAADTLTPASAARTFHRRLDEAGVVNELVTMEGAGHAFELDPALQPRVAAIVQSFLARHLDARPGQPPGER